MRSDLAILCNHWQSPVGLDPTRALPLLLQVTGEAQYVDDLPLPNNALHAAFVLSTRPHAKILSIESAAAEQVGCAPLYSPLFAQTSSALTCLHYVLCCCLIR